MGSFASGMFSVLLGWIRSAVSWLWQAALTPEGGGVLTWMAENWLVLTLILCGVGMAVDFAVYLLRWQPYKVWASFFRRLGRRKEEPDAEPNREQPHQARPRRTVHRQWLYADGTARTASVEDVHPEEDTWQQVAPAVAEQPLDREVYMRQYARPEEQAAPMPPAAGLEDYPQPAVMPGPDVPAPMNRPEPPSTTAWRKRMVSEGTRAAIAQLFSGNDEDELDLRYKPAQPAVSKEEAYNKPYYPPQWKPPANSGK
ncbi:MAG: hypothetical protein ACI4MJ_09435 [Aristaeellaceae bacterium]